MECGKVARPVAWAELMRGREVRSTERKKKRVLEEESEQDGRGSSSMRGWSGWQKEA